MKGTKIKRNASIKEETGKGGKTMKRKILIPIAGICLLALAVFGAYRVDMERMA